MKKILGILLLTFLGSVLGVGLYTTFLEKEKIVYVQSTNFESSFSKYTEEEPESEAREMYIPDFIHASDLTRPAVVHIKAMYNSGSNSSEFFGFRDLFDEEEGKPRGQASGSGVIISPDGYIATNNHVIEDADKIEVVMMDNRSFTAKVIGRDINTDLALLKVNTKNLPYVKFGDSDDLKVGEWVLAVGNPLDLNSTVTAGIVSAKGRNINLLSEDTQYAIESFIQTDAAVNRGNSGGALVNLDGELVGINTAIASKTGYYAGYSFAIPASIAKKVMADLLAFGEVKRGFLGVTIQSVNAEIAEIEGLATLKGAYVTQVNSGSGAAEAGIRRGDVITEVNGVKVNNTPDLQEQVSRHRPGDEIRVRVIRGSSEKEFKVLLKTIEGKTLEISEKKDDETAYLLGSTFRILTQKEMEKLAIDNGIMVEKAGEKLSFGGIHDGFVITNINGFDIEDLEDLEFALQDSDGYVTIKGLYNKGMMSTHSFSY